MRSAGPSFSAFWSKTAHKDSQRALFCISVLYYHGSKHDVFVVQNKKCFAAVLQTPVGVNDLQRHEELTAVSVSCLPVDRPAG